MRRALTPLVAVVVFLWCFRPMWDMDLFWHVAIGREILRAGIPEQDIFSAAHPDAPWHTFQWAYEVLVAVTDAHFGLRGLQTLHAAVLALAAGLAFGLAERRAGAWLPALSALMVGLLLLEDRVRERPHVFEVLFVVALLPMTTARFERLALPAVALAGLWSNLHAVSSLWWLALVGACALPTPRRWPWVLLGALVMVASPMSRAGLWGAFASHSTWPDALVPELRNTWTYAKEGWWGILMLLGVGAGVVAALERFRRPGWEERLVGLGCAVAALLIARWAWLAAVPIGFWLCDRPRRWQGVLALACALALGMRVLPRWGWDERFEPLQARAFPVAACDFLAAKGLAAPMDAYPQWSGYALYRLHPPLRVLTDGRLVFGPDVVDLMLRRFAGEPATFDEAAARYGVRLVLWPTRSAPPLDPSRWTVVYRDDVATVFGWISRSDPR